MANREERVRAPSPAGRPEAAERGQEHGGDGLAERIGRKAERKLKARAERDRSIWYGLGLYGLVGWSLAVPTLLGIALGTWLDARFQDTVSWTLTLLLVGVVLGALNAWYWVRNESRPR